MAQGGLEGLRGAAHLGLGAFVYGWAASGLRQPLRHRAGVLAWRQPAAACAGRAADHLRQWLHLRADTAKVGNAGIRPSSVLRRRSSFVLRPHTTEASNADQSLSKRQPRAGDTSGLAAHAYTA